MFFKAEAVTKATATIDSGTEVQTYLLFSDLNVKDNSPVQQSEGTGILELKT